METYKTVSQDIRDQLNAEAEAVQIILTWIDNDIYSIVDACPNACEMWKAIKRLKQGESINVQNLETNLYWEFRKFTSQDGESLESYYSRFYKMMNELIRNQCDVTNHQLNVQFLLQLQPEWQRFMTLVKQSQELKTVSYHKLYDILKQHQNEVNEIRAERIARTANPLTLVAQQQPVYHPQNHPTNYTQNSSTRSKQAATKNRGKAIDKEIDKLMALISLSFKKIYKPTKDNSPRINRGTGIQCYNYKEFGHVAREYQKPKRAKDVAYHREKMLLCKQEEAGIQLNTEQADWRDDTDDESEDQELEAHYMYMAQIQEVSPDAADSGPIFDYEPVQKVSTDDHYNVFAIESEHPEQSESVRDTYPIEQDEHIVIIDSLDMSHDREQIDENDDDADLANERELLASLIVKLKCEIDNSKNHNKFLETSNKVLVEKLNGEIKDFKNKNISLESSNNRFKEANNKLSETNKLLYNDFKKSQVELARHNDVEYASKFKLYKTREDKELDKVIALENKVKVLDNIAYKTGQSVQIINMLNNKCRTSFAKPEFLKKAQRANPHLYEIGCYNDSLALILAPESDEVICLEKESRTKLSDLIRPFDYDKLNNLYDLFVPQREKSSEQRYFSERSRLSHTPVNNGNSKESFNKQSTLLEKRMDESILWDQKCKSSKELFKIKRSVGTIFDGVEHSLKSQLETQTTEFLNEIDRLSREYYYADHMNAILGVYTKLDEEDPLEDPPEVSMADNRTMAELLQALTEGYEDAIVIPEITANNFEPKHGLINLVQNKQFFRHEKEDPHAYIRYFNKITSTMRVPNVPSSSIKLMIFPFSLEGQPGFGLKKNPLDPF
nr:Gag-Pol polyprotein [Tanacetum cinerariifolium]